MAEGKVNSWGDLFTQDDTVPTPFQLPSGRTVFMSPLSSADMLVWFAGQEDPELSQTNGLRLVAQSLVNEAGDRIGDLDHVLQLREKSRDVVVLLMEWATRVNGLEVKPGPNASSELPAAS